MGSIYTPINWAPGQGLIPQINLALGQIAGVIPVVISVTIYGAVGDGSTDDTAAIQAALNAAPGLVYLPPGNYKTTSTLTVSNSGTRIMGAAAGAVVIASTVTTTDVIHIAATAAEVVIENLLFVPSGSPSAGAQIACHGNEFCTIRDVNIDGGSAGIAIDDFGNGTATRIETCLIENCSGPAIVIGQNSISVENEVFLSDISIGACQIGLALYYTSGIYCQNVSVFGCSVYSLASQPASPNYVSGCYFTNCIWDSAGADNIYIGGTGLTGDLEFIGGEANSATNRGFHIDTGINVNGIRFVGMGFENNQWDGALINSTIASNVSWDSCYIYCNSQAGSAMYNGISVASDVSNFKIRNCEIGAGGFITGGGGSNLQAYAIDLVGGTTDVFIISNNDFSDNVSGGLNNGASGATNFVVANNITS